MRFARPAKVLIDAATGQIHPDWKVGLTGANGSGKSSLFALLHDVLKRQAQLAADIDAAEMR